MTPEEFRDILLQEVKDYGECKSFSDLIDYQKELNEQNEPNHFTLETRIEKMV